MSSKVNPVPEGFHTVTPYLVVEDAEACLSFLERAFDGEIVSRHDGPDGTVRHAEARIGDSMIMLGQGNEEWPPTRSMIHLYVEDADRVYGQALEAGARSIRELETMFYGDRTGGVEDPQGTQWWISTRVEEVSAEEMARRMKEGAPS
jgi:PhnB protein